MKVLIASSSPEKIIYVLRKYDDWIRFTSDPMQKITLEDIVGNEIDIIVSFGNAQIFGKDIVERTRIVNLHGGMLPLNRGPNPNLWSWLNGTLRGVTIHEVDEGIDTGPIIAQKVVEFNETNESLQSSFDSLAEEAAKLFSIWWDRIRMGKYTPEKQTGIGSSHRMLDQAPFQKILENNLHLPLPQLRRIIEPYLSSRASGSENIN